MERKNLYYSLGLHLIVIVIFSIDFMFFHKTYTPPDTAPLILDLSELETPVVPKEFELKPIEKDDPDEVQVVDKVIRRADLSKIFSTLKQLQKTADEQDEAARKAEEEAEKKRLEEEKKRQEEEEKKLAELEEERKRREAEEQRAAAAVRRAGMQRALTMADQDEISRRLKACWNVDTGKKNIENTLIEVRVKLTKEGVLMSSELVNKRMLRDPHMRSVAESALRAVQICALKEDSPFKLLAEKHPKEYDIWETLLLRFNPVDGGVLQ